MNLRPILLAAVASFAAAAPALARPAAFTENFDDVASLPSAGWNFINRSQPLGTTNWYQGTAASFSAHSGAADSYMAANYNNVMQFGTISNWAILPEMTLNNGDTLTFFTRKAPSVQLFPDRLEVRLSENGSSADVGLTAESVGDFSTLLLSINPDLGGDYPYTWTQFSVTLSGLAGPISGRLAFRYFVTEAGVSGTNADYIGIDTLEITKGAQVIPLPAAGLLAAAGFTCVADRRRRAMA